MRIPVRNINKLQDATKALKYFRSYTQPHTITPDTQTPYSPYSIMAWNIDEIQPIEYLDYLSSCLTSPMLTHTDHRSIVYVFETIYQDLIENKIITETTEWETDILNYKHMQIYHIEDHYPHTRLCKEALLRAHSKRNNAHREQEYLRMIHKALIEQTTINQRLKRELDLISQFHTIDEETIDYYTNPYINPHLFNMYGKSYILETSLHNLRNEIGIQTERHNLMHLEKKYVRTGKIED